MWLAMRQKVFADGLVSLLSIFFPWKTAVLYASGECIVVSIHPEKTYSYLSGTFWNNQNSKKVLLFSLGFSSLAATLSLVLNPRTVTDFIKRLLYGKHPSIKHWWQRIMVTLNTDAEYTLAFWSEFVIIQPSALHSDFILWSTSQPMKS